MRALIVDDNIESRNLLRNILEANCPDIEIAGEADDICSGTLQIQLHKPDLVFLDIELKTGTGFDLLQKFPEYPFEVIFITSYQQYAITAFKFSAIDYLLKPVDPAELVQAVEKVAGKLDEKQRRARYELLLEYLESNTLKKKKIFLPGNDGALIVSTSDISWLESKHSYTLFHLKGPMKELLVSRPIKDYDELLADCGFYRIQKSYVVNLECVKKIIKTDGGYVLMDDGSKLPVSRNKRDILMGKIRQLVLSN